MTVLLPLKCTWCRDRHVVRGRVCTDCRPVIVAYSLEHGIVAAAKASGVPERTIEDWRRKKRQRVGPWAG